MATILRRTLYDDEMHEIARITTNTVILVIVVAVAGGLLLADILVSYLSISTLVLCILVEMVCCLAWMLNQRYRLLGSAGLVTGLCICASLAVYTWPDPLTLGLFPILVMVTAGILNVVAAGLVAAVGIVAILVVGVTTLEASIVWASVIGNVAVIFVSYAAFSGYRRLLANIRQYQHYAIEQLLEARESRGELARTVKALSQAETHLQHANAQLRYARDMAEEARRLKAQFATNVSHELRTPINLIVGFSEIMAVAPETYGAPLPANYVADIHAIYRYAKHLQSLINDILDISQIDAGRMAIFREEASPLQVLLEASSMARDLIEGKGLVFRTELPPSLPMMRLDCTRIRQVVINLLANAARFTDSGSVTLRARVTDDHIQVSVIDTGVGISSDQLERVFDEFYQVETSAARTRGGTGLGLALSQQFIRQHGGRMWVESQGIPGKGSAFSFTLPLSEKLPFPFSLPEYPLSIRHPERRILVYDSDPAIVQLFKGYMRQHQVVSSCVKSDVPDLLEQTDPSIVVLANDTASDGVLTTVRSIAPDIPLITCPVPSGKRLVQAMGVADYLVKPVSRQRLLDVLERMQPPVESIIIVEDDRDMVRMIRRMLVTATHPYRVRHAYGGRDGLALVRSVLPDVVLLDILMPETDGFSVIHQMKADPDLQRIPIVVVSARGSTEAIAEYAHGDVVISSPHGFKPIQLVRLVEAATAILSSPIEPAP